MSARSQFRHDNRNGKAPAGGVLFRCGDGDVEIHGLQLRLNLRLLVRGVQHRPAVGVNLEIRVDGDAQGRKPLLRGFHAFGELAQRFLDKAFQVHHGVRLFGARSPQMRENVKGCGRAA